MPSQIAECAVNAEHSDLVFFWQYIFWISVAAHTFLVSTINNGHLRKPRQRPLRPSSPSPSLPSGAVESIEQGRWKESPWRTLI